MWAKRQPSLGSWLHGPFRLVGLGRPGLARLKGQCGPKPSPDRGQVRALRLVGSVLRPQPRMEPERGFGLPSAVHFFPISPHFGPYPAPSMHLLPGLPEAPQAVKWDLGGHHPGSSGRKFGGRGVWMHRDAAGYMDP